MKEYDVAIIGAGHAGLNALKEIRKVTDNFILVNGGVLGTTCARIGCMPSKVAIRIAEFFHLQDRYEKTGQGRGKGVQIHSGEVMEQVRELRDTFVDLVLANTTDDMGDELIDGYAEFVDPNTLQVGDRIIRAKAVVIASGARSYVPPAWQEFHPDLITVENFFELEELPRSAAVIGLGPIGLEIGQALHRLGVAVTGIETEERIARIDDPEVNRAAVEIFSREFPLWTGVTPSIAQDDGRLIVQAGDRSVTVDKVFLAVGRRPNVDRLRIDRLGVPTDRLGVPHYDPTTMQVGDLPVFIAGDVTGRTATLQRAADEGRIAGFNAVRPFPAAFKPKTPMSIVFSEPNIVAIGSRFTELDQEGVAIGQVRFGPVGRAMIMRQNRGILRVYADKASGRILGGSLIGPRCEHLAHLVAWAVEHGMTVADALQMPYYHPVIEEALQDAMHDLAQKIPGGGIPMNQFKRLNSEYPRQVQLT